MKGLQANTFSNHAVTIHVLDCAADDDFEEAIEECIHVVAVDSGTWPTDGGGVATCRELVLDYVQHVRWSVLSEIGNDFKQVCLSKFLYLSGTAV